MEKRPPAVDDDGSIRPRGRPRSEASRLAILSATQRQLENVGYEALTVEAVAADAGVGKATIYRWWASKGALAMEAFLAQVSPVIAFASTDSAAADIARQMRLLAAAYRGKAGAIVREMVASSQSDAATLALFTEGYLRPRREAAADAIRRGIRTGEFRKGLDVDATIDALYGPVFYRLLLGIEPIDDRFCDLVAGAVLGAARPAGRRRLARVSPAPAA